MGDGRFWNIWLYSHGYYLVPQFGTRKDSLVLKNHLFDENVEHKSFFYKENNIDSKNTQYSADLFIENPKFKIYHRKWTDYIFIISQ